MKLIEAQLYTCRYGFTFDWLEYGYNIFPAANPLLTKKPAAERPASKDKEKSSKPNPEGGMGGKVNTAAG